MKATELRIGNLVERDGNLLEVIRIAKDGIINYDLVSKSQGMHVNSGNVIPIPLTEEWLLKFGFFIVETNGKFEATLPNFRYNIYWDKCTYGFLFCDGETVLINFNYVHELQNLVFVLGRRELTVA